MPPAPSGGWPFEAREVSKEKVWVVVEKDNFKDAPHIYVVLGKDKAVLIDTGCDTADLRGFLLNAIPALRSLPLLVVNILL